MSMRKSISTFVLAAGAAAMSLVTLGSAAQAYDGYGHSQWRNHDRSFRHYAPPARYYNHDDHSDRRRNRNRVAQGLAIGVGAVILGTILAAEANRQRDRYYND